MTRRDIGYFSAILTLLGAGWGLTVPLTKIAVSTGFGHFGLIFWQLVIGTLLMGALTILRRKRLPITVSTLRVFAVVALIGTLIPNSASYQAAVHVPAGILSILLSMIPMFAFPVALFLKLDRFSWRRFSGLAAGFCGVAIIVMPGVSRALETPVFWMLVALIAGLCYAIEGNVVSKWGTADLDPVQVLFGASALGTIAILPFALMSGQFIPVAALNDTAGHALIASSLTHSIVYAGYVWMVGRAGPVFAVQVSYFVTGFGILWAHALLGEAYPPAVWAALGLMFAGMYLVQPRHKPVLAPVRSIGDTGAQH
ncbi:MAG: DMT family transporter [Roseobacter sp.]